MARSKRTNGEGHRPEMDRTFEGDEVLAGLLGEARSSCDVAQVRRRFAEALARGQAAGEAIATLWEAEPRFASPSLARRVYSNLFGLWDSLGPAPSPGPKAPAPEPEWDGPGQLTPDFVEAAWRWLEDLPPKEMQRLLHRFENGQPELSEAVRFEAGESDDVLQTADTLAFFAHWTGME